MAQIEFVVNVLQAPDNSGPAVQLEPIGTIDSSTLEELDQVLEKLFDKGAKKVLIDCKKLNYVNSSGLALFLKYSDTFAKEGRYLAFWRIQKKVMLAMELLGFNQFFDIINDQTAQSVYGAPPPPSRPASGAVGQ